MEEEILRTATAIIERSETVIITSVDSDGYPNVKAMLKPREKEGLKTFYFTTNSSSMRVKQYLKNPKAAIYFFDPLQFQWIMLKGTMEVKQDQKTKDRIWRDGDAMYYSKWIMDPDYSVLKFTAEKCRMYNQFRSYDFEV